MTEWIKCSEKTPDKNEWLITYHESGAIRYDVTWDNRNKIFEEEVPGDWTSEVKDKVTHWMLPPKPPVDDEKVKHD